MEAKLIKNGNAYSLKINGEYVAFVNEDFVGYATQEFRDNLLGKLSLKNCQAIELGYDLMYLAKEYSLFLSKDIGNISCASYHDGFQKALEILGDKKFSEEDMRESFEAGNHYGDSWSRFFNTDEISRTEVEKIDDFSSYIKSLQQTAWDVEIEMECPQCQEWGYISECRNNCNKKFLKPKLDVDGCLILKRK
jgi:hypothetical protein